MLSNLNYNKSQLEAEWQIIPTKAPTEEFSQSDLESKSIRLRQGIVLRNYFHMVNQGNVELFVYHLLLDGQPCVSKGFEVAFCMPFTVGHGANNTAIIELRYQPDFTISYARKTLTLVTNIGDLDYLIEVKIPNYMLTTCHDSLPRPLLETCLLFIFVILTVSLLFIMLAASLIESKSIVQFHLSIYKRVFASFDDEKISMSMHEFGAPPPEFLYDTNHNIAAQMNSKTKNYTAMIPKQQKLKTPSPPSNSNETLLPSSSSATNVASASSHSSRPSSPSANNR
jgi:hypothetical protein